MIRIAVTGPESSGKTTLSLALGQLYQVNVIPEYARNYLELQNGNYTFEDLEKIAQGQLDEWIKQDSPQICDTEMTVIKIWSEVKYRKISPALMELYDNQHVDHYFLCRPDIPWEPDPLREHPEERDQLFELYKEELTKMSRSFTIIHGSLEERMGQCTGIINSKFPFFKK